MKAGDILVRLHAPIDHAYVMYDAGEVPWMSVPGHKPDPQLRRWPGASENPDSDLEAEYGGTVYLVQERPENEGGYVGYTARWEALRGGVQTSVEIVGPWWEGDFPAAVAWARERAPYVLIHHPSVHGYQSAGEFDLPGLNIPRWEDPDEMHARLIKELPPGATHYSSQQTWDAVGQANGEWLLVEAKANQPEFCTEPTTATRGSWFAADPARARPPKA